MLTNAQIVKQTIEYCRQTREYKRLTARAFRNHSNYISYKRVVAEIVSHLVTIPEGIALGKPYDVTWSSCVHACWNAYNAPNFPVYALTNDLVGAFVNSTPPTQLWGIKKPFERALIMLPQGSIINPDRMSLDWILMDFLDPYQELTTDKAYCDYINAAVGYPLKQAIGDYQGLEAYRLRWIACFEFNYIYSCTIQIPAPDDTAPLPGIVNFAIGDKESEVAFTDLVTGIAFQTLLYMNRPKLELPKINQAIATPKRNKHQKRIDPSTERDFIWVGKDYYPRKPHQGGQHNSPTGHPRRGHYRTLPWRDAGEQEIWVRPSWVGSD